MLSARLYTGTITTIASKQLKALWETGKSRIDARFHKRILRRLDALDAATAPEDIYFPVFDFHALKGDYIEKSHSCCQPGIFYIPVTIQADSVVNA